VLDLGVRLRYHWPVGRVAIQLLGGVAAVSRYGNFWDLLEQRPASVLARQTRMAPGNRDASTACPGKTGATS